MDVISVGPWGFEEGTHFSHSINCGRIQKLVLIYEGGFKSLLTNDATETPAASTKNHRSASVLNPPTQPENIIKNSDFRQPIGPWRTDDCAVKVISGSTGNYVIVSQRKNYYDTIRQDITGRVCVGCAYEVSADVSVKGGNNEEYEMSATVKIENMDNSFSYLHIGSVFVKNQKWKKLQCTFQLNRLSKRVIFYIEGPPPNIDLCIGHVSILPLTRRYVVNLDQDEYLTGIVGYNRKIQKGMSKVISSLTFLSNRTKYGPYGPEEGTEFSFKTTNGEIIGFHGTSGTYLNSVGCHVKPLGSSITDIKAEKVHLASTPSPVYISCRRVIKLES